MRSSAQRWRGAGQMLALALGAVTLILGVSYFAYRTWQGSQPQYQDAFAHGGNSELRQAGWQSYGGTWEVRDGAVLNISDDRGAKLINGSRTWKNYIVDADIELLGEFGDAGFLIRTSEEEVGVDAYHGYFAGLRDTDETLILGRADYGWHEFQAIPVRSGIFPRRWYHLRLLAYACTLVAVSTTENGEIRTARMQEPECIEQGRFGLQSYSTGAAWKNLSVRPADKSDLDAILKVENRNAAASSSNAVDTWSDRRFDEPMQRDIREHRSAPDVTPIANLRLLAPNKSTPVTVHGVVTMLSPMVFVQDSTGGLAISGPDDIAPLKIGDTIEANGEAEPHDFSSVLHPSQVRVLWSHTPVLPVSVSASQAATGAFDAQYVETEGKLESIERSPGKATVLKLEEGYQSFMAVAENPELAESMQTLRVGSRLRLRGICVSSRSFVQKEIPFALLMRSAEDAEMIEPPPWWSTAHIVEVFGLLLLLSMGVQMAIHSSRRAQLHAVIEERERLAMEMHDTLAQSFAGLGYQLEGISRETADGSKLRSQLETSIDLVRFGHEEARRNIAALRPGNLEQLGLARALEQAACAIIQGGGTSVSLTVKGEAFPLPLRIADTLMRIGQESIANAVRHGHPKNIQIQILYGRSTVRLVVRDDGQGFIPQRGNGGFGIRGMTRRAEGVGAVLKLYSSPGKGTIVAARVRLSQSPWSARWWQAAVQERWRRWIGGQAT